MFAIKLYKGWFVLAGGFISMMLVIGLTTYGYGLFAVPVRAEFDLSRQEVSYGQSAIIAGTTLFAPIVGRLMDRFAVSRVMALGALLLAMGLIVVSLSHSLWLILAAAFLLVAVGGECAGGLAALTVTARWFRRRRGRALGIVAIAASAGGFIAGPLVGNLIELFGWRNALAALGIGAALVILLVSQFLIKNRPTEAELREGGEFDPATGVDRPVEQRRWGLRELIQTPNLFFIAFGTGLLIASDRSIFSTIPFYLTDQGISLGQAGLMLSVLTGSAMVGKLLVGFLGEIIDIRWLYLVVAILHVLLLLLFMAAPSFSVMVAIAAAIGVGLGGVQPIIAMLIGTNFGAGSFASAMGLAALLSQPISIAALALVGRAHDQTGSYDIAFAALIGVVVVSTVLIAFVKPPATSARSEEVTQSPAAA